MLSIRSLLFIQLCSVYALEDIDDRFHTIEDIVLENGFLFEQHNVTTDDGYILSIHRIQNLTAQSDKFVPPILIQHGIE